jgi:hypothetical protein
MGHTKGILVPDEDAVSENQSQSLGRGNSVQVHCNNIHHRDSPWFREPVQPPTGCIALTIRLSEALESVHEVV